MKEKITTEDILAGNYVKRTSDSVKKKKRPIDLVLIYGKRILVIAVIISLYYGYSAYCDAQSMKLTEETYQVSDSEKITKKFVTPWSGGRFDVDGEITRTGKIINGTQYHCPKADAEVLYLNIKDNNDRTVCLQLYGLTKGISDSFTRIEKKDKREISGKYKNKTVSVVGYGSVLDPKSLGIDYCYEYVNVFASKYQITD